MKRSLLFVVAVLACLSISADNFGYRRFNQRQPRQLNATVETTNVRKLAAAAAGANFTIDVTDVTATSATITVTPADPTLTYYFDLLTPDVFDTYSEEEIVADYKAEFDDLIDSYAAYGYTFTYADVLSEGIDSYTYSGNLDPNTEYVAFAVGIDPATFTATTAFDTVHFTTAQVVPSQNQLTLTANGNGINITTTNSDPYFFWIETLDEYLAWQEDYSEEALLNEIDEWIYTLQYYGIDPAEATLFGSMVVDFEEWWGEEPEYGQYIALAAPYEGAVNGQPAYVVFDYSENGITGIKNALATDAVKAKKVIRNGQLIIERNGVEYNAIGAQIK